MADSIGTKGGKRDLKLTIQNRKRKNKKEIQEMKYKQKKKEKEAHKKKEKLITILKLEQETSKNKQGTTIIHKSKLEVPRKKIFKQPNSKEDTFFTNDDIKEKRENPQKGLPEKEQQINQELEKIIIQIPFNLKDNKKNIISISNQSEEQKLKEEKKYIGKQINNLDNHNKNNTKEQINILNEKKEENISFLEQHIIKVLEQELDEKKYSLKKLDSEIYAIQQSIDPVTREEELLVLEQEISKLINKIEKIKKQIIVLERTLDFKFPIESPDNYLIYLVEEYKNNRKEEINLEKTFQESKEYKTLIDTIIIIEKNQETIQKQLEEKKNQMKLDEEQIKKLQDDIIDIEEIKQKMSQMMEKGKETLEEITNRLNETVQITEKVNYITMQVNHSLLELFLLMTLFKRNLSIKNSVLAATTASLALDIILKMTTPIQEKKIIKEIKITDYKNMIENCITDTNFLENTIHQNLNKISSLRYTFEHSYQSCSYLPSYQEALEKLLKLEENMKEQKQNIIRMKQDMEFQLEKNEAKVKKYNSIKAA